MGVASGGCSARAPQHRTKRSRVPTREPPLDTTMYSPTSFDLVPSTLAHRIWFAAVDNRLAERQRRGHEKLPSSRHRTRRASHRRRGAGEIRGHPRPRPLRPLDPGPRLDGRTRHWNPRLHARREVHSRSVPTRRPHTGGRQRLLPACPHGDAVDRSEVGHLGRRNDTAPRRRLRSLPRSRRFAISERRTGDLWRRSW
jgi:hypothetical protein